MNHYLRSRHRLTSSSTKLTSRTSATSARDMPPERVLSLSCHRAAWYFGPHEDRRSLVGSRPYLAVAVPLFAILVCWIWWRTVAFYRNLFLAKFKVLREIEEKGQLFHIYEREDKVLREGEPPHSLLANEGLVPVLVAAFSCWFSYAHFINCTAKLRRIRAFMGMRSEGSGGAGPTIFLNPPLWA
jgi:hypothetical protein